MALGERIRKRRIELDMTQAELAKKAGVTEATINRYESGEIKNPRQPVLAKLINALEVEPNYIMGWEETAPPVEVLSPPRAFLMDQLRSASEEDVKKMEQLWKMIKDQDN